MVKVDLAKAYDNLSWNLVNNVLYEIGFLDKLIQVIMANISSMSMNIRWNGIKYSYFQSNKGLR